MPLKAIKRLAKKYGVSVSTAEKKWKEATKAASKSYSEKEGDAKYGTAMNILKAKLKKHTKESVEEAAADVEKQKLVKAQVRNINTLIQNKTKAYQVAIKLLKQKLSDLKRGIVDPTASLGEDKVTEDGAPAITTTSIAGTATTQSGAPTTPAFGGNAAYYAPKWGQMMTRYGTFGKKKKKRKKLRDDVSYDQYISTRLIKDGFEEMNETDFRTLPCGRKLAPGICKKCPDRKTCDYYWAQVEDQQDADRDERRE